MTAHHDACCNLPEHLIVHAIQMLCTSNLLLGERLDTMNAATSQILTAIQDDDLKVKHLITLVDGLQAQIRDLNVTIQNLPSISQDDVNTLLDATKAMGSEIDAEIAKIPTGPTDPGTGLNPPAETLTGFTVMLPDTITDAKVGESFPIRVQANGASGVIRSYTGTINLSAGALQPTYTFTSADAGVHDFMARFDTPGSATISVTDATAKVSGSSVSFNVVANVVDPLPPNVTLSLTVTGPVTAGQPVDFDVTASDPSYVGTIGFTSDNAQTGLPSQYTFRPVDGGKQGFSIFHPPAGATIVVTATDTINPAITGSMTVVVP